MTETSTTVLCIGPSHKTASLSARERFAMVGVTAVEFTRELHAHPDVLEVVSVDTCNRNEMYVATSDVAAARSAVMTAFGRHSQADLADLETLLEVRQNDAAVRHLYRVAAGMESVVIGEPQIQGQLKTALEHAHDAGTCGAMLDRLFRGALEVGKRVRSETAIGRGSASVGTVAAQLLDQQLGGIADARILVIGAGRMGELAVRCIVEHGARHIVVANRSIARAAHIAEQCRVDVIPMEDLDTALGTCDAVISATNAPHVVLTRERLAECRSGRSSLVLLDLAVPRDIDPAIARLDGCQLFDLDDLERVVAQTMHVRSREFEQAETMVAEAVAGFLRWRREQDAVPVIIELRQAADAIRSRELERFMRRAPHLSPEDRRRVEQLTRSIVNRLLHAPTEHIRQLVAVDDVVPSLEEPTPDVSGEVDDPWTRAVVRVLAGDRDG